MLKFKTMKILNTLALVIVWTLVAAVVYDGVTSSGGFNFFSETFIAAACVATIGTFRKRSGVEKGPSKSVKGAFSSRTMFLFGLFGSLLLTLVTYVPVVIVSGTNESVLDSVYYGIFLWLVTSLIIFFWSRINSDGSKEGESYVRGNLYSTLFVTFLFAALFFYSSL
jgi:hypothetical protein